MRYLKLVFIALMFVGTQSAMAGTSLSETATIKSVDVENNTITVEFDKSGITKTFSFPEKITLMGDGVTLIDKSAFKPGQSVNLQIQSEKPKLAKYSEKTKPEYTLTGMTVK